MQYWSSLAVQEIKQCGQIATRNKNFDFSWILVYDEKQKEATQQMQEKQQNLLQVEQIYFYLFPQKNKKAKHRRGKNSYN